MHINQGFFLRSFKLNKKKCIIIIVVDSEKPHLEEINK